MLECAPLRAGLAEIVAVAAAFAIKLEAKLKIDVGSIKLLMELSFTPPNRCYQSRN